MDYLLLVLGLGILVLLLLILRKGSTSSETPSLDGVQELMELRTELGAKNEEVKHLKQKIKDMDSSKEEDEIRLKETFKNLASQILETNSEKFKKQNKEQIGDLLSPLGKEIEKFKNKVEQTNKDYIERNSALSEKIKSLESLNIKLSQDAINLTNALKGDAKTQGDWGEIQLEVLLEKSGLMDGVHFSTQGGYKDEDGKIKKPDFIIHLPENKHLIIDAKVSLTAYESYYNAEDDSQREISLKKHIDSIRSHFNELSGKNYPSLYGINAPDHVLMFVPIEPALMLALHEDQRIYLDALDKNIVLLSTSTLLATLSTIASIWKQEDQKRNVLEIAKEGGLLYDKFEGFVSDLLSVGKSLKSSQDSYQEAMNKLVDGRGNIIKKVENLKALGAKTKKSLPQKIVDRASFDDED
ncbi:MAG: DNA recombination protein RmuC [Flavobacteriales bacterium]|nr:DNA recombination protein RmuC [Flavobacteriales bacterium]|tara:strand:+ start:262 stop:1497 length:1236 start_codon:yes stop_codon:yes gene_type:complete